MPMNTAQHLADAIMRSLYHTPERSRLEHRVAQVQGVSLFVVREAVEALRADGSLMVTSKGWLTPTAKGQKAFGLNWKSVKEKTPVLSISKAEKALAKKLALDDAILCAIGRYPNPTQLVPQVAADQGVLHSIVREAVEALKADGRVTITGRNLLKRATKGEPSASISKPESAVPLGNSDRPVVKKLALDAAIMRGVNHPRKLPSLVRWLKRQHGFGRPAVVAEVENLKRAGSLEVVEGGWLMPTATGRKAYGIKKEREWVPVVGHYGANTGG